MVGYNLRMNRECYRRFWQRKYEENDKDVEFKMGTRGREVGE